MTPSAAPASSSVPLLPAQRDTALANVEPGVWKPLGSKDLLEMSDRFDAKPPEDARINSIPDLWARPLLFQLALYDERHSLHKRVVGEWRGLLAVLAFKERRQLPVRKVSVSLDKDRAGALLKALARLTPLNTLHASAGWRTLELLTWRSTKGEKPIGMLSPTTLVATAASCEGRIDRLPWFDFSAQCLRDPSSSLNAAEKGDLANWLFALRGRIGLLPHANEVGEGFEPVQEMHDKLLKALDAFGRDLGVTPAATMPANLLDTQHRFGFESELYEGMNHPLRALAFNAQQSHVRLVPSAGRVPARDALVLDPSIERQFGRPAREIIVYDTLDLSQALAHTNQAAAHRDRVNLWEKKNFFTDRLLCVTGITNAFPGALPIRGADSLRHSQGPLAPLPPLRAELLDYVTAAELADGLSFQQESDAIKVNLRINLSGPDGRVHAVTLDRVYREAEIERVENLPIVEVWPNLASPAGREGNPWKSYYAYFSTADYQFADPQGHPLTFAAQPYPKGDPTQTVALADGKREVRRLERFPEAFVCTANRPPARAAQEPVGLLLLPAPRQFGGQPSEWSVGIDFGTSSTNVYYRAENGNQPSPMRFQDRTLAVTGQKGRDAELYREFVPGQEVPTPFLTLFRIRDDSRRLAGARPLLDGTILYLGQQSVAFDAADSRLRHNLKWNQSASDREATLAFLRQLALQCAAEAVAAGANTVRWCFSYPSAFSERQTEDFRRNWAQICEDTEAETGVGWAAGAEQPRRPQEKTESLAVACYFIELHRATLAAGSVFVDIGGGTTDISIWHGGRQNRRDLQLQTSVLYAGREMFIDPLRRHGREVLPGLLPDPRAQDRLRSQIEKFPADQDFARLVDMVVTQHNDAFMRNLPRLSGQAGSERLKADFALRLCGLLHYVGLLVRSVLRYDEDGVPLPGERMPDFYFAGNGARVLNWLELGTFSDTGIISRLLLKPLLAIAAGFPHDTDFRLVLSRQPKAEVAAGLVVPDAPDTSAAGKPRIISGEAFNLPGQEGADGRQEFPWSDPLTKDSFAGHLQLASLDQLQAFLGYYAQLTAAEDVKLPSPGPLTSAQQNNVFKQVQERLTPRQRDEVVVEPLFILALKEYLLHQS